MIFIPLSVENVYSPAGSVSLASHPTSCTPTKPHLCFDRSSLSAPVLYVRPRAANHARSLHQHANTEIMKSLRRFPGLVYYANTFPYICLRIFTSALRRQSLVFPAGETRSEAKGSLEQLGEERRGEARRG
jgi:hypothetical protein